MGLHKIRLAAPWELRVVNSLATESDASAATCKLPFVMSDLRDQIAASDSDTVVLTRKFHRPSGLDESTRVFIGVELDGASPSKSLKTVMLNKEALPLSPECSASGDVFQFDVSGRLLGFNELQLRFPSSASDTLLRLVSVSLLIEEQAVGG